MQDLLTRVARNEGMWGSDYLAGPGRRLCTVRRLLIEAGEPVIVWARPAEARVDREAGGLLTETLAILVHEGRYWSILDTEVLALDELAWDRLLGMFVARWYPQFDRAWHYVQPATDEPTRIEDWLPEETGPGRTRIARLVDEAVAARLEEGTGQAICSRRADRL